MTPDHIEVEFVAPPPKFAGYYDWGGVFVEVRRKPNRFQRLMIRWFFGWKWIDKNKFS